MLFDGRFTRIFRREMSENGYKTRGRAKIYKGPDE